MLLTNQHHQLDSVFLVRHYAALPIIFYNIFQCFSWPSGASQRFVCSAVRHSVVIYPTEKTKYIVMSQVFTCIQTHAITQHFLPCFCLCFIWKLAIPVCKHPKTITIVADNWTADLHLFVYLHTSLCGRACRTSFYLNVHKCTLTHVSCVWLLEIPEPYRKAALFLLLNQMPIVQSVCPCCHRRQSMKHPSVSIGYLLHKIYITA